MLAVISPAKALDFSAAPDGLPATQPALMTQTRELMKTVRGLSARDLSGLMHISEKLGSLNHERFQAFASKQTTQNAKQAALAFAGDTYKGLQAGTLSADDLAWAQDHLRILSGLYGLLRPLDLIQPYRLEMGTRLHSPRGESLYDFWGERITRVLNDTLVGEDEPVLVNLASIEYFSAVKPDKLKARLVTPVFRELRDGVEKIISFSAKQARGMMARFIVEHRLDRPEGLKDFAVAGYRFRPKASGENEWVFVRKGP